MSHDDYHQRSADEQRARLIKDAEHGACEWIEQQTRRALEDLLLTGHTQWPCHEVEDGYSICIGHLIHEYLEFLDRCEAERIAEEKAATIRRAQCPQWGSW